MNTNTGAQIALKNLNVTDADLASVQKRISTGLKVSDANDNGAIFAIAQGLRSDVTAISTVNSQLRAARGLVDVSLSALTQISDTVKDLRSVLIQLSDQNVTGNARTQLNSQFISLSGNIVNYMNQANYNGTNLIQTQVSAGPTYSTKTANVISDIGANQITIGLPPGTPLFGNGNSIDAFITNNGGPFGPGQYQLQAPPDANVAKDILTNSGTFAGRGLPVFDDNVSSALNTFAAQGHLIDNQITLNFAISDSTTIGLGALVDADLAKESAKLQSLQIKQQLGTQSLGIANQSPQSLLSLFR